MGGFVLSPHSVSHQPSARKRTIHSLITCQSLHTKLALLYFFFFGTISGHRDKQPLRNELKGGPGRKDGDGSNGRSGVKTTHGYQDVMLRSDLVKDYYCRFDPSSDINVNFTVHTS